MKITLPTNLNNKLSCKVMVHIAPAPKEPIPERKVEVTQIEIITADDSYPPSNWQLLHFIRQPLGLLADALTLPSHGLSSWEFYNYFKNIHPTANPHQEMAAYYYKKI